jgi:hypothetical protein
LWVRIVRGQLASLLVVLLAGCLTSHGPATSTDGPSATVTTLHAMTPCVNVQRDRCFEPTVAVAPDGAIYVMSSVGTQLARSPDGGKTWETLAGAALPDGDRGALSPSDAIVRAMPSGRVVVVSIASDPGLLSYAGIHVAVSADGGRTWPVNRLLSLDDGHDTAGADRPWVIEARDGSLLLEVNEAATDPTNVAAIASMLEVPGPSLYLASYVGNQIQVARSTDGGATWGPFRGVTPAGRGVYSGEWIRDGDDVVLPVVIGPPDLSLTSLQLYRSHDDGQTWTNETVLALADAANGPDGWPSLAAASDGALALAWATSSGAVVVQERTPGKSWSEPVTWSTPGEVAACAPAIRATPHGWAVAYASIRRTSTGSAANFTLAVGHQQAEQWVPFARDVAIRDKGANTDFTTLDEAADGRLLSSVSLLQPVPGLEAVGLATGTGIDLAAIELR